MSHVPIPTVERLRELFDYTPSTGVVTRRSRVSHNAEAGRVVGARPRKDGRRTVTVDGRRCYVHHIAWALATGDWPTDLLVDHKDGDPSNNRQTNLRLATHRLNSENQRRARADSKTGLLGASPYPHAPEKFVAHITIRGVRKNLGVFETADLAHNAYLQAKREHHEGCLL